MEKVLTTVICTALVCVQLIGCSQQTAPADTQPKATTEKAGATETTEITGDTEETGEAEGEQSRVYKIGINSYAENFESSQRYLSSFRAAAEKAGNVELVYADCNADPQKLAPNYDAFILQNVDAIIDASWMGEVGPIAVEKCKGAGIPLVVCDSPFDEEYSYLIGTDQYQAGVIAGKYLADYVKENWDGSIDYLVLEYFQSGGPQVKDRMQGCLDGLQENGIPVEEDQVFWFDNEAQTQKTNQITRDFLTSHPDATKIIFGTNNDPCAIGVVSAVEASNRVDNCISYSYGGEDSALDLLKKDDHGYIGSVSFQQLQYGDFAIPAAIDLIEGKTDVPRSQGPTPFMIDRGNLAENSN